jgi:hypothetical protein
MKRDIVTVLAMRIGAVAAALMSYSSQALDCSCSCGQNSDPTDATGTYYDDKGRHQASSCSDLNGKECGGDSSGSGYADTFHSCDANGS